METSRLRIIALWLLLAACAFGAAPSLYIPWAAPRGTGGIVTSTNPALGTFTIDGSKFSTNGVFTNATFYQTNVFNGPVFFNDNFYFQGTFVSNIVQIGDLEWTNSGGILRPRTANAVATTNHEIWTTATFRGHILAPSRAVTLSLGSNFVQITNAFILLESPTNDASQVSVFLGPPAATGDRITLMANSPSGAFTIFDGSAAGGTGFTFLQGDWVANSDGRAMHLESRGADWIETGRAAIGLPAPAAINPTTPFLPYRSNDTAFGDTPMFLAESRELTITNFVGTNRAALRFATTNHAGFIGLNSTAGDMEVSASGVFIHAEGTINLGSSSKNLYLSGVNIIPSESNTFHLGSANFPLKDLFLGGTNYLTGDNASLKLVVPQNSTYSFATAEASYPAWTLLSTTAGAGVNLSPDNGSLTYTAGVEKFGPSLSNAVDNASRELPWRTNYVNTLVTGDPGSGAGAWQYGKLIQGASVALVTTNYIEVKIDGTVRKLAVVQ